MKKNRIFWGIIFLLAAVFLVIGKLGYIGNFSIFSLIFTIFLLAIIIKSIRTLNFSGILFPIAFLCITYDKVLNIESLTPWTVLAVALLGSIGLSMLFHNRRHYCHYKYEKADYNFDYDNFDIEDKHHVKQSTRLGASTKYINSDDFKQADLECSFGAMQIYFNKATIQTEAIVRIHANFAGIELYIPKEWKVENHVEAMVGAVDETGKCSIISEDAPVLKLVGEINISGIKIIYV